MTTTVDQRIYPFMVIYPDRIAYLLVTPPGGADGLDPTDKGGVVRAASFDLAQIESEQRKSKGLEIRKIIVEDSDVRKSLALLGPLDRLLVAGVLMDERNHIMAGVGR